MKPLLSKLNDRYLNLVVFAGFAIFLLLVRSIVAQNIFYWFLPYNLFLAAVPYLITQRLLRSYPKSTQSPFFFLYALAWLLFLPNSPYIFTDLIHVRNEHSYQVWIDLFLISVYAVNGLLLGLLSLVDMRWLLSRKFSGRTVTIILFFACLLSGFGIYLGRFLRFNSWDVLVRPLTLFVEIFKSLQEPLVWGVTAAFGGFLWISFLFFQVISKNRLRRFGK